MPSENSLLGTHVVIDTARRAFLSVEPILEKKGYHFMEYYHPGTVRMFLAMFVAKNFFFDPTGRNDVRCISQPQRLKRMKKLGLISMKTETENSSPYPTFLIKKLVLSKNISELEDPMEFCELLSGKTPRAAIEAIRDFIVEVNDEEILPEVKIAVKAWRDNLNELFEAGKISVCVTPRVVLV